MERGIVLSSAICLLIAVAHADTVTLDNGKSLEGQVIDNGEYITIEMAQGSVRLHKSRVAEIIPGLTPQSEFAQRAAEIQKQLNEHAIEAPVAAERFFALGQWAGERQIPRLKTEALKRALELDPEHRGARAASGYVEHDGRWVTIAERNQALGMVQVDGKWVPQEAAQDARQAREEARDQKEREDRQAEAELRLKQAQAEKLEAERDLLMAQREDMDYERGVILPPLRSRARYVYPRTYWPDYIASPWCACPPHPVCGTAYAPAAVIAAPVTRRVVPAPTPVPVGRPAGTAAQTNTVRLTIK